MGISRCNQLKGLEKIRRVHFVGIGGVGMSGLAQVLAQRGWEVSGSDLVRASVLGKLRSLGVELQIGHRAANVGNAQMVVFSSAVSKRNPELLEAQRRGIAVVHRGEVLAQIIQRGKGIAIAGTHGKTTTTSMVGFLLLKGGLDPTVIVGAHANDLGGNARLGKDPWVVAEADESDGSFLKLHPHYSVVTNIDKDHLDHYGGFEEIKEAFAEYMNQVPENGWIVVCAEDSNLRSVLKKVHRPMVTYGMGAGVAVRAEEIEWTQNGSSYTCEYQDRCLGRLQLRVPGHHNVLNSLAAVAVGLQLQVPFSVISNALGAFTGVERRLQVKGERFGARVIDDYGHHPAEIRTTLDACRQMGRKLVVVFQPHRYSRTFYLRSELASCFQEADLLYLMDVYSAGEEPIPGGLGEDLAEAIGQFRQVFYQPNQEEMLLSLWEQVTPGTVLLTIGAGNVWEIGEAFLEGQSS